MSEKKMKLNISKWQNGWRAEKFEEKRYTLPQIQSLSIDRLNYSFMSSISIVSLIKGLWRINCFPKQEPLRSGPKKSQSFDPLYFDYQKPT